MLRFWRSDWRRVKLAKVSFQLPDDFLDKISRLEERTDEIVPRVLEAGGEVALEAVRRNLQAVVGHGTQYPSRSSGELTSALGLSPAKMDWDGNFNVKVGFAEPHSSGASNAMIANVIEYGKHTTTGVWSTTRVCIKADTWPANENDGFVVQSTTRNQYATDRYTVTGLTNGKAYYIQAFPISNIGLVNFNTVNRAQATPIMPYTVWGLTIDESVAATTGNSVAAVTYTDAAIGMTGGSSAWDSTNLFKNIRPCVFRNGSVQYYLNRSNYAQKEDGSVSDISSGNDGDVMIEIPKIGIQMSKSGSVVTLKMTDNPNAAGFNYFAHSRAAEGDRDFIYIGAYKAFSLSGSVYSLSGRTPTQQALATHRTQAQARGDNYSVIGYYQRLLIQCLYLMRQRNLDSDAGLGRGVRSTPYPNTGAANANGMWFGHTSNNTTSTKLAGIENFFNSSQGGQEAYEGLAVDGSGNIYTTFIPSAFNSSSSGFILRGTLPMRPTDAIARTMINVIGNTAVGFLTSGVASSSIASDRGYYDNAGFANSGSTGLGATYESGNASGVFAYTITPSPQNCARIMYV